MKTFLPSALLATAMVIGAVAFAQEQQSAPTFSEVDADHNGVIDRSEAERSEQVNALFVELDTNQDGQLNDEEYAQIAVIRTE